MLTFKYGEFATNQVDALKEGLRKRIFFLILLVDENTADNYKGVDVERTFESFLAEFGSLNELLGYPAEMVSILSLVNAARLEYESSDFSWKRYRKYLLTAGSQAEKIKED